MTKTKTLVEAATSARDDHHNNVTTKKMPPKKQKGMGKRPRTINGLLLDVRSAAALLGTTEKSLRGMVARQLIPFRRFNSRRIVFLRSELDGFLTGLPGVTLDDVKANIKMRSGGG
ncbi:MAG: helix-turn-helix domain-containing protein [Nitrospira sp.]|nr:MAG: helix-turn-helix domain-containing protein [Nitrospira sp.]